MKSYFPNFYKKIGIVCIIIAIILSFIANINDFYYGFVDGWNSGLEENKSEIHKINPKDFELVYYKIISDDTGKLIYWISLLVSFLGFLLYLFAKEKVEDEFIRQLRYKCLAKSLLFAWIATLVLLIINGEIKLEGMYILQFQLFIYIVLYNYYIKVKFN